MNRETVTLTQEEQQRAQVLARIQHNTLRATEAAPLLGLSIRQVRRLLVRVRKRGLAALPHGNRGRPSPRRIAEAVRAQVLTLARTRYVGVNDHQLTELLRERDGVRVSRRTVQRLLRAAGIGSPRTRRAPRHRRRRERMLQAGLLVQIDGSHHPWLEDRGPRCVLLAAIDDATGRVVAAVFRDAEDTQGYFLLLRQLVRRYGVPAALYTDRHTIFSPWPRTAAPTLPEQLRGHRDRTQLGRAFHELGIRWIGAHSPQATDEIVKPPVWRGRRVRGRIVADAGDRRTEERSPGMQTPPRWLALRRLRVIAANIIRTYVRRAHARTISTGAGSRRTDACGVCRDEVRRGDPAARPAWEGAPTNPA